MSACFFVWKTSYDPKNGWSDTQLDLTSLKSELVTVEGTGLKPLKNANELVQKKPGGPNEQAQARTSRSFYWAFCDALKSGVDPLTGGAPQLVSMYSKGHPIAHGIIYREERYIWGTKVEPKNSLYELSWRDELFQEVDPISLKIKEGAQRHQRDRKSK